MRIDVIRRVYRDEHEVIPGGALKSEIFLEFTAKKAKHDPVVQEVARMFKAEIRDIHVESKKVDFPQTWRNLPKMLKEEELPAWEDIEYEDGDEQETT